MAAKKGARAASAAAIERGQFYLRLSRRVTHRLTAIGKLLAAEVGLTDAQWICIYWVRRHEGITQAELTAELDSDRNTVSAVVRKLEAKKLLVRRKHPTDGRAACLYPTAAGKVVVDRSMPSVHRLALRVLDVLPEGHEAAIAEWMNRIIDIRDIP